MNKLTQSEVNQCFDKNHDKLKYELVKSFDQRYELRKQLNECI